MTTQHCSKSQCLLNAAKRSSHLISLFTFVQMSLYVSYSSASLVYHINDHCHTMFKLNILFKKRMAEATGFIISKMFVHRSPYVYCNYVVNQIVWHVLHVFEHTGTVWTADSLTLYSLGMFHAFSCYVLYLFQGRYKSNWREAEVPRESNCI